MNRRKTSWSWKTYGGAGLLTIFSVTTLLTNTTGCKKDAAAPATLVTVQAGHPEHGEMHEHIVADAVLAPLAQAAILPKITAPVSKFYVQRGSKVKAGQILATLENRDLKAAAMDNKGSYSAAQASYETATRAQVPDDLQRAQLDVLQAKANLDLNQSIVTSRKQLFSEGAIPGRDLDTATAALVQAQAAYDAASRRLESMQKIGREASLKAAQGQLESAKGKYEGAQAQVDYSEVRSPIDGIVTDRPLFAGETAAAGSPLIVVMDTSALLAKVHLAQAQAQRLSLGDAAEVTIPGVTTPVEAKVSLISPALDPGSTTIEVWLRIENKKGTFKAGTPVRVSIEGRGEKDALKVPATAVITAQDGSKSVMVIGADSKVKKTAVSTDIQDGEDVQITRGVSVNDMVVTGGAYGLDDGTQVKIGAAESDADDAKPAAGKEGDK
jgi:HlyD family secretion protein